MQMTERTQRAVLRYLLFLQTLPFERIAALLPSITDLRLRYEVGPECAMALLRPRLRRALHAWDPADPPIGAAADADADAVAGDAGGAANGAAAGDAAMAVDGEGARGGAASTSGALHLPVIQS
jgi:hypothetical protein